jgi:hypothetical protein
LEGGDKKLETPKEKVESTVVEKMFETLIKFELAAPTH